MLGLHHIFYDFTAFTLFLFRFVFAVQSAIREWCMGATPWILGTWTNCTPRRRKRRNAQRSKVTASWSKRQLGHSICAKRFTTTDCIDSHQNLRLISLMPYLKLLRISFLQNYICFAVASLVEAPHRPLAVASLNDLQHQMFSVIHECL